MTPLFDITSGCDVCSLKKEWQYLRNPRMKINIPEESSDYRILVLGEGPGETEDNIGVPFVGTTGQYLRDRIPQYWKKKLHWGNIVRCKPPRNREPSGQEIACCSNQFLEKDLSEIKPNAILCFGDVASKYFWSNGPSISKMRGLPFGAQIKDSPNTWIFPSFHPSYPSRADKKEDGKTVNVIEPIFRNDLIRFFELVTTKFTTPPKIYEPPNNFVYPKSYQEAWNLFERLKEPYANDFETFKLKPYMRDARLLTAAYSDGDITFAFPVEWPGLVNYWGKQFLIDSLKARKTWIAQNASMELPWIRYMTGLYNLSFEDTEVAARLNHNRKGMGALNVLSRLYLGFDLKALHNLDKDRMNEYPLEQVLSYNGLDSWGTALIYNVIMKDLVQREQQIENYYRIIQTIDSTVEMELRGLLPDINQSELMQKDLYEQQQELEKKARQIKEVKEYEKRESRYFSVSSRQDVASVLTRYCGIQLPKNETTQEYYTDEDALTELAGEHPLVDTVLEFREVQKQLSTYVAPFLNGSIIGIDGLIHPEYTTVHVATYRLSARNPNIENFPKRKNRHIRRQIIAPAGHLIVAFDYGGLELRTIQMASKDKILLRDIIDPQQYLHDKDIHWYWLHRLLELYPPYIMHLAEVSGEKDEKSILKVGRTIIKTDYVFPSFYGSKPDAISARTTIPKPILEQAHHELWSRYPDAYKWTFGQFEFYQKFGYIESLTHRIRNEVLPGNEKTNSVAQGTGAEIVLEAQNALYYRAIREEDPYFLPRINIHDDITTILPDNEERLDYYIPEIGKEMTQPRFPFITCPLLVECSAGYNWCDLSEIAVFTGVTYDDYIGRGNQSVLSLV